MSIKCVARGDTYLVIHSSRNAANATLPQWDGVDSVRAHAEETRAHFRAPFIANIKEWNEYKRTIYKLQYQKKYNRCLFTPRN